MKSVWSAVRGNVVVDAVVAGDVGLRSGQGGRRRGEEVFGIAVDVIAGAEFCAGLAGRREGWRRWLHRIRR